MEGSNQQLGLGLGQHYMSCLIGDENGKIYLPLPLLTLLGSPFSNCGQHYYKPVTHDHIATTTNKLLFRFVFIMI